MKHIHLRSFITVCSIIGPALLVVWPACVDRHWNLMDDGATLTYAKAMQENWSVAFAASDSGRYRPFYFIPYALQYKFFGTNVTGYYFVQAGVLIFSAFLLYAIVNLLTNTNILGYLAILIFLTSSPVIESYYTLSKSEPWIVLFFLASLYFYLRADLAMLQLQKSITQRLYRYIPIKWVMASSTSLMIAYLTKETTFIILAVSLILVVFSFILEHRTTQRVRTAAALAYFGMNLVIFILFVLMAYVYTPTPLPWTGSYTASLLKLGEPLEVFFLYLDFNFDVIVLAGLVSVGLLSWVMVRPHVFSPIAFYTVFCILCSVAYLGLFAFIWQGSVGYYLLPIAAWTAIAISLLIKLLILDRPSPRLRVCTLSVLILSLMVSRAYSIPTAYNIATALKAWDKVNAQMMTWVASLPRHARLLCNYPSDHEYLFEIRLLLSLLYDRTDIALGSLIDQQAWFQQARPGDSLLINFGGIGNPNPFVWARGVNLPPLEYTKREFSAKVDDLQWEEVFRTVSTKQNFLPFTWQPRPFVLGWAGYRLLKLPELWLTKHADGWIGREADLWVADATFPRTVVLSGQSFLPPTVAYPIQLEIWSKERRVENFTVQGPGTFEWRFAAELILEERHQRYSQLKIVADKTFIPARDTGGPDTRELSVLIDRVQILRE